MNLNHFKIMLNSFSQNNKIFGVLHFDKLEFRYRQLKESLQIFLINHTIIESQESMYTIIFSAIKLILMISILLFCLKVAVYKQALSRRVQNYQLDIKKNPNDSTQPKSQTQVLQHLKDLTAFPILGGFYNTEKINQLCRLKRHEQALATLNQVLQSPFSKRSFILWFIKAQTEITLKLYEEAQSSLAIAGMFTKRSIQDFVLQIQFDRLMANIRIDKTQKEIQEKGWVFKKREEVQAYIQAQDRKQKEQL